jgi:dipeptidyl aminopeptidase/acylaminoacyl peptidase
MHIAFRLGVALCLLLVCSAAEAKHILTFEDLAKVQRIDDPQLSPDGKWIAYQVGVVNLAANKTNRHIWLMSSEGGEPRQLTQGEGSDSRPRWSPDGKSLAFVSTRGGKSQVWILPMDGGEARQLTSLSTEADGVVWAGKSDMLLFTSQVYPDCADEACNSKRLKDTDESKVKAQVFTELLFRHWDSWRDGRYTHLFAVSANGGTPRDLTPGAYDSPTFFLGAPDGYAISPDGTEVCYTSNRTKGSAGQSAAAWTTNNDLYIVGAQNGEPLNITADNPGSDASPQYSPNGRYIAYTSQARNGYESDLFRLRVYDRESGKTIDLTPGFDQWVGGFAWAPDNDTLYFTAPDHAHQPVFKTSISAPKVEKVLPGMNDELTVSPDGTWLLATRTSLTEPSNIYRVPIPTHEVTQSGDVIVHETKINYILLSHENQALLADLDLNPAESLTTPGAQGADIESLMLKPPGFDPAKQYPGLLLVHGGPQGAWEDAWGYRWNAQMFAARGYVVVMTNFHGSTGYGQKFVESISGDWGGAPYLDLMNATDFLSKLPYVDKTRIVAAGASYGGFMIDWIATHTDRFKALVSHDGVYDNPSMFGETEEVWFDEWEFKGLPWEKEAAALRLKWSPSSYVQNIKTPMLLVQGGKDFRVPEGQAFQLFTALQRRGIKSKLLYFPDEGHWVLKPQNSQLWYKTVLDWLDEHVN